MTVSQVAGKHHHAVRDEWMVHSKEREAGAADVILEKYFFLSDRPSQDVFLQPLIHRALYNQRKFLHYDVEIIHIFRVLVFT